MNTGTAIAVSVAILAAAALGYMYMNRAAVAAPAPEVVFRPAVPAQSTAGKVGNILSDGAKVVGAGVAIFRSGKELFDSFEF